MGPKKSGSGESDFDFATPDRMKAASEVPYAEQPKPIKTVGIEEFQRAVATLQRTDPKIPPEITKKAISSTNLLPVFDLERSFTIDLPSIYHRQICWL